MDESYLDQLLKKVEKQDEALSGADAMELSDSGMGTEQELEQTLAMEAGHIQDVAWSDSEISVDELSELDALDELADLDMDSLDFDDIDFDDVDITSMNVNPVRLQEELENLEKMDIDETYLDDSADQMFEQEFQRMKEADQQAELEAFAGLVDENGEMLGFDEQSNGVGEQPQDDGGQAASMDVDSLMQEVFGDFGFDNEPGQSDSSGDKAGQTNNNVNEVQTMAESSENAMTGNQNAFGEMEQSQAAADGADDSDEMEDLFAMLGIESGSVVTKPLPENDEIPDFEIPPELSDVEESQSEKPKKKGFMDVLFGDDEEDALTPEQEAELAKEKEEKKKAKEEKKKAKKSETDARKKKEKAQKTAQVEAKKAARKAEDERILAEDGPEKKLNKPLSVIIILFFLGIGGFVIAGTYVFDYALTITKASNYFERQKYGMAYREIIGVEVLGPQQELEDKIYTVMYVERQHEAYENYVKMNRPDLALDALVQGLGKYDEYYEDAVALGIEGDIDTAHAKIVTALETVYGMDLEEAYKLLVMDSEEYTQQIQSITANMDFSAEE